MSFSKANPAWGRLQVARADDIRRDEIARAKALQAVHPDLTWGQALVMAALHTAPAK